MAPVDSAASTPVERGLTTIVIPCYNQRRYLGDAIRSALVQDSVEVVVVDDGSTDGGASIAEQFDGVRTLRQENRGVAAARNTGARAARGEFVLFLDADDRLKPGAVAALRAALDDTPAAAFAYGRFEAIDTAGSTVRSGPPRRQEGEPYESLLQGNFICAPATVMYRLDALLAAGGFPPGLDPAADYAMYLRLSRDAPSIAVPLVVAEYRAHLGSMSRRADRMLRATLRAHGRERTGATTPALRRAWSAGRTHWRRWYGEQLVDQIRAEWRARRMIALARDAVVLARYAPAVLVAHARKKIVLVANAYFTRYSTKRSSS